MRYEDMYAGMGLVVDGRSVSVPTRNESEEMGNIPSISCAPLAAESSQGAGYNLNICLGKLCTSLGTAYESNELRTYIGGATNYTGKDLCWISRVPLGPTRSLNGKLWRQHWSRTAELCLARRNVQPRAAKDVELRVG